MYLQSTTFVEPLRFETCVFAHSSSNLASLEAGAQPGSAATQHSTVEKVNPLNGEIERVRRFILRPKEHNHWFSTRGYQAFLPELQHFSSYCRVRAMQTMSSSRPLLRFISWKTSHSLTIVRSTNCWEQRGTTGPSISSNQFTSIN